MRNAFIYVLTLLISIPCYAQSITNPQNNLVKKKNFIGLGVGENYLNVDENKTDTQKLREIKDRRSRFWNVYTGHKISDNFSLKAEYLKLADFKSNQQNFPDLKVRAISFSALGFYPITKKASIFGEAGIYRYRAKQNFNDELKHNTQSNGTKPFVGVGLKYDLGKTDLILKYSHYGRIKNDYYKGNLGQVAFNVEYKF